MNSNLERATPVEIEKGRSRRRLLRYALVILLVVGLCLFWRTAAEPYPDIGEHFKYGSIGADNVQRGVPYWLWRVLPELFPEHLPSGQKSARFTGGSKGYAEFGFLGEPGRDRPIGFSKRHGLGIDVVGLNCAVCHTGAYRESPGAAPVIVLGMPANTVNLQGYFRFLFDCAADERFTVDRVMAAIQDRAALTWYERQVYPLALARFKEGAQKQQAKLTYWEQIPAWGPGRVDTFTPYKRLFFDLPPGDAVGTSDFPSLWLQRPRQGMHLHWDGNNDSVFERNISAAFGAGVVPDTLDHPAMKRIADWILDFPPPKYPKTTDAALVEKGKGIYAKHCAACHGCAAIDGFDNDKVGTVTPIGDIQTDPNRLLSFTPELAGKLNTLGAGYRWRFRHFRKTEGYANMPLDGVWLRAPYLHNGSVPTLHHLLLPPAQRPKEFYRGNDLYDWKHVGFVWDKGQDGDRKFFRFDTAETGNGNGGHLYGTDLPPEQKKALLEYLKTL